MTIRAKFEKVDGRVVFPGPEVHGVHGAALIHATALAESTGKAKGTVLIDGLRASLPGKGED